jgi:hypothetical protein
MFFGATILGLWLTDLLTERLFILNASLNLCTLTDRSVATIKRRLVERDVPKFRVPDYNEPFSPVVLFVALHLLLSIIAGNGFVPQQLNVLAAFLYRKIRATIFMHLPEG